MEGYETDPLGPSRAPRVAKRLAAEQERAVLA
jgi:hypothetical protein